jgi:hypothetical protein
MTEARIGVRSEVADAPAASGRAAAETPAAAEVFKKFRRVLKRIIALKIRPHLQPRSKPKP